MEQKVANDLIDSAKKNLLRFGYVRPVMFMEERTDNKLVVIMSDYTNNKEKDIYAEAMRKMLQTGRFKSYLKISESWVVVKNIPFNGKKVDINLLEEPSKDPNRMSAITVSYRNDDGSGWMKIIPYEKIEDKYHFRDTIHNEITGQEQGDGRFWNIWG